MGLAENAARNNQGGDSEEGAARWATRLHLTLPNLGEVDAQIRLQGNQITLAMSAGNAETRALMRASGVTLRSQLDQAGISLASMGVAALPADTSDGQAGQ
jgi:flagellar hook-length control protein FliK